MTSGHCIHRVRTKSDDAGSDNIPRAVVLTLGNKVVILTQPLLSASDTFQSGLPIPLFTLGSKLVEAVRRTVCSNSDKLQQDCTFKPIIIAHGNGCRKRRLVTYDNRCRKGSYVTHGNGCRKRRLVTNDNRCRKKTVRDTW